IVSSPFCIASPLKPQTCNRNSPLPSPLLSTPQLPGERFSEIVGSPFYIAPEVLHESYGPESDIWAAGVILFVLLSGALPFWGDSDEGVFRAILEKSVEEEVEREGVWESVSDEAKDLVLRMLSKDAALRITADEILGKESDMEIESYAVLFCCICGRALFP
ncbi:unnamed protein product, partial [Closterium sp. NIES-53]